MNFIKHSDKVGKHAMLSASSWRWIDDDREGLLKRITSQYATVVGDILHKIACEHIRFSIKLNKYDKKNVILRLLSEGIPPMVLDRMGIDSMFDNLLSYVNDCIGYKMTPEVVLMYSDLMWATTDAIIFDEREHFLRIHDLKSGVTQAHMEQLLIYEGLFCLEYQVSPEDVNSELRIYQSNQIIYLEPTPEEVRGVMDQIVTGDQLLREIKQEV